MCPVCAKPFPVGTGVDHVVGRDVATQSTIVVVDRGYIGMHRVGEFYDDEKLIRREL